MMFSLDLYIIYGTSSLGEYVLLCFYIISGSLSKSKQLKLTLPATLVNNFYTSEAKLWQTMLRLA